MNYHTNESRRRFLKTIGGSAVAGAALSACGDSKEEAVDQEAQDLHICMGLNTRPLTKDGKTYQPGECQCANIHSHACIGGNSCANLGACGTGTYDRQYWISENLCGKLPAPNTTWDGTGGCGVPIGNSNTGFISTQLNNASPTEVPGKPGTYYPTDFIGKPVWNIARSRFESKMAKQGKSFGKPADLTPPLIVNSYSGSGNYDRGDLPKPYPQPSPPKVQPPKSS